jgi:hypothetical protein
MKLKDKMGTPYLQQLRLHRSVTNSVHHDLITQTQTRDTQYSEIDECTRHLLLQHFSRAVEAVSGADTNAKEIVRLDELLLLLPSSSRLIIAGCRWGYRSHRSSRGHGGSSTSGRSSS